MSARYDFLLTEPEKERFSKWEDDTQDNSLSTLILSPLWERLALLVPQRVAPNVISLAGLLCTIQAFYLCYVYHQTDPFFISIVAIGLVSAYQTLDALDGIQARRTMNASPVGALWDHACDNVGIVFVALVGCYLTGIRNPLVMWYVVQIFSLLLLLVHLESLRAGKLRYGILTGPGESIFAFQVIGLTCAFVGTDHVLQLWLRVTALPVLNMVLTPHVLYYATVVLVVQKALSLSAEDREIRNGVLFCLLFRVLPAVLFRWQWVQSESLLNVVCDGLFVSVITTDVALCKMTRPRQLHPWLWVFAMASVLSYGAIIATVVAYYSILFSELTSYMKLPMFTLAVNVYVDGVYDLLHLGHLNIFMAALQHGNRLFVGVLSDESVAAYKRRPVMTMEERAAVVATCKGVYKVIPNAPFPGIPRDFLQKWNIHVVCLSTEYDKPDDIYYAEPRKLGMTRVLPRTNGISTSDIIKRVKMYGEDSKQKF